MPKNRIAMLRQIAGLRPADIASRLGVTETTARRWESGKGEIPDGRKLALADLFEVSVPFLMGWPEIPAGNGETVRGAA
jgi:transcriptional regulator with XRE-family HTH domain